MSCTRLPQQALGRLVAPLGASLRRPATLGPPSLAITTVLTAAHAITSSLLRLPASR